MQQNSTTTFEYDEKEQVYNIHIEKEDPLVDEKGVEYAKSKTVMDQTWNQESIDKLLVQLTKQLSDATQATEATKAQLGSLGKFTEREIQNLVTFTKNLEKAQKLQQKEKLDEQLKMQEEAVKKLTKDVKEVTDGIAKSRKD